MNLESPARPSRAAATSAEVEDGHDHHEHHHQQQQQQRGRRRWRRVAWAAAGAQVLSLCTAGSSSSSQRLSDLRVVAPSTQLFFTYALLGAVFLPAALLLKRWLKRRRSPQTPTTKPPGRALFAAEPPEPAAQPSLWRRRYPFLALLDAEANTLVTAAIPLGGASVTSATLLGCLSVPAAMVLSWFFLGHRYAAKHVCGAVLALVGLVVLVLADARAAGGDQGGNRGAGSSPLWGDLLAAAGAALYAASNVAQERLLSPPEQEQGLDGRQQQRQGGGGGVVEEEDEDDDQQQPQHAPPAPHSPPSPSTSLLLPAVDLLAALGCFGALITGAQALLLDRRALAEASTRGGGGPAAAAFASFALCLFVFYSLLPAVLTFGGATLLNLSLLTGNLWAALARVALFGGFSSALELRAFGLALLLVAGGLGLYASAGPPGVVEHGGGGGGGGGGERGAVEYRPVGVGEA